MDIWPPTYDAMPNESSLVMPKDVVRNNNIVARDQICKKKKEEE